LENNTAGKRHETNVGNDHGIKKGGGSIREEGNTHGLPEGDQTQLTNSARDHLAMREPDRYAHEAGRPFTAAITGSGTLIISKGPTAPGNGKERWHTPQRAARGGG